MDPLSWFVTPIGADFGRSAAKQINERANNMQLYDDVEDSSLDYTPQFEMATGSGAASLSRTPFAIGIEPGKAFPILHSSNINRRSKRIRNRRNNNQNMDDVENSIK